jgi:Acetyltransferase (GNAT) domain
MKNTIVRPYHPGDESGILTLYRDVFNVNLSPEMWEWCYRKVPEKDTIIVVAENDDGIVGHYGIQPRPFWLCGQPCLAGLTVGTMVHPSARNLTTLVEMATMAYDLSRQEGLSFLYSFSRDEAWKVRQVVLGWQALPQITAWEGALPFTDGTSSLPVEVYETLPMDAASHVSFPMEGETYQGIGHRNTPTWFNWRFFQNSKIPYKLLIAGTLDAMQGCAVLKVYEKAGVRYGHIVDWQVPLTEAAIATTLLESAWQEFAHEKVEQVSCWALPQSSLFNLLQESGLTRSGKTTNFGYLNLSLESDAILSTEHHWNIFMGDSDVY